MFNFLLAADETTSSSGTFGVQQIIMLVIVGLLLVALFVFPMISNKKRKKAVDEMHNSISVGDTIMTIGGIVGKVVAIKQNNDVDKEFVLETGMKGKESTMTFSFQAIYQVLGKTKAATPVAEAPASTDDKAPAADSESTAPVEAVEGADVEVSDGEKKEEK